MDKGEKIVEYQGMFLLKSGLRFSFRALEVPVPRVRKSPQKQPKIAIFAKMDFWGPKLPFLAVFGDFSSLSVRALPVPETKI